MRINNFKKLERQEVENMDQSLSRIKNNVTGSLGLFRLVGDVVELFLPKIFGLFVSMSKPQEPDNSTNKYPNTSER